MNKFDKFVCEYIKEHTIGETIQMLRGHREYLYFCKYDHSPKTLKKDDMYICHINSIIAFLTLLGDDNSVCPDFKTMYYEE